MPDVERLTEALVRYVLQPTVSSLAEEPLDDATWASLLGTVDRDGLVLALDRAVLTGDLAVSTEQGQRLAEMALRHAASVVRVERSLVEVSGTLAGAGFDVAVLKGIPSALRFWPDPEMRMVRDVDLLVRSADIDGVVHFLEQTGSTRLVPQLRPGFDRRFGKAVTVRTSEAVELDIHRTLVYGPHAFLIGEDLLWDQVTDEVEVGGVGVRCFSPPAAFVHACLHAASGGGRRRTSDLVEILTIAQHPSVTPAMVGPIARLWMATAAVVDECRAAAPLAGGGGVESIERDLVVTERERQLQEIYAGDPSARALAFATVGSIPGLRAKAAYLAALALPSRSNLRARNLDRSGHLSSIWPLRGRR